MARFPSFVRSAALAIAAFGAALSLSACEKTVEAPMDSGVCYHMATQADGALKFNVVARNVKSIELCAAQLEGMRLRFLRLGGQTREITGAYQGSFIFVKRAGIYRAQHLESGQYLMLVRIEGGRLAQPGAIRYVE